MRIPLANLDFLSPYGCLVWESLESPIALEDVAYAIEAGHFNLEPLPDFPDRPIKAREHVARVAYLVVHGWDDAIHIDVGVPSVGRGTLWPLVDGNHRLAAAIYRKDYDILAEVSGEISYAEQLLGISLTSNAK